MSGMKTSRLAKVGVAALATALMVSGCGSRASDTEIAEALRGPASTAVTDSTGAVAPGTVGDAAVPAQGGTAPAAADGAKQAQPSTSTAKSGTGSSGDASAPGSKPGGSAGTQTAAAPTVADKSPVKIGQLGTFSGVLGAVSSSAPKVLSAWISYTNAHGGLNGHPLQLVVADDQGDPSTSLTLAKRLVESDKALMMVGNFMPFGFPQVEQYVRSKGVPMLGDGVDPGWFTSPVAHTVVTPAAAQIVKALQTFVDDGASKIGILYCLEIAQLCGYLNDQVRKSEVGKYVVESYQVSLVAPSYTSQCLRMKQAGIEVLYLLLESAGAARAAKDCAAQGFTPQLVLLSLAATADLPKLAALNGAVLPSGTVSPAATGVPGLEKYRRILGTYAASLGDSGIGVYAFASAEMLGVIGKNLPNNPTSADFLEGMSKVKNETLGGLTVPLTYPKGKGVSVKPCAFIWGLENGRYTAPKGSKPIC
ncbi:ABC transporter substrate-binding protein [Sporichthya brevicatena]|uniref:ABC transporter substrate-binding protein n=2 Tax=Sporichthya brevicatena TaxID=171442 RepID=A0ABN1GI64_9ACTN